MIPLVRAEWTKLFTTRVWIGLVLGACLLAGLGVVLTTIFAGDTPQPGQPPLPAVGTPLYEQVVLGSGGQVGPLFVILGIIGMTQEYRHRTATPTFLTTPRRGQVVVAKLLAYAVAAVPLALLVDAFVLVLTAIAAGIRGDAPSLTGDNLEVLGRVVLVLVIWAVIGVGVGALLRNQVGAVVGALVYLFVVEGIVSAVPATQPVYRWLPGGAANAVLPTVQQVDLLEPWQGGLVLLGYGLLAALLGTLFAVRRDVT